MEFVLYNAPQSTCSQKARITLLEKGLTYSEHKLDLFKGDQLTPEYTAINPNGVVPSLVHDGVPVIDSSVIMEYLQEIVPDPSLAPERAIDRAHMREWMRFFEEVPTPAIRVPSYNLVFLRHFQSMTDEEFIAFGESKPLRKDFFLKMGRTGYSDDEMRQSLNRLRLTVERMESALDDGRTYLLGDFSLADICVLPTFLRMNDIGLSTLWSESPGVARWFDAASTRPAVRDAMYPGSLLSEKYGESVEVDLDRYFG